LTATEENEDWTNPQNACRGRSPSDQFKTGEDKSFLLLAFLEGRGLVEQDATGTFNYFINHDLKNIPSANNWVVSEVDPKFPLSTPMSTSVFSAGHGCGSGGDAGYVPTTPQECNRGT